MFGFPRATRQSLVVMDLSTVLQRVPDVSVRVNARNEVSVCAGAQTVLFGAHALRLLEVFHQPITVGEALTALKPSLAGAQEWVDALRTISQLQIEGVLRSPEESAVSVASRAGFDQASIHIGMLNDRERTNAFIEAVRRTVKPGDVVVDLGTGTGVLAIAAAKAGAARVYAIEAGNIAHAAEKVVASNGLGDRVIIKPGWSTHVELPGRADVIVGELLGNEPFGENIVETFHDAIRRFLKPGGRVIPAEVKLYGVVVTVPADELARRSFGHANLASWRVEYGIDFSSLAHAEFNAAQYFLVSPHLVKEWPQLTAPVVLASLNLQGGEAEVFSPRVAAPLVREGVASGVLLYFESTLAEGVSLTTSPQASSECSWRNVVWLLPETRELQSGGSVTLHYERDRAGQMRLELVGGKVA
ncbi:MAG: 50S ribosomal protein L11 methyltransferase [Verrucomicrobiota bacterium]